MSACEPVVDGTAVGGWGSGECCLHLCGKQIMVECLPNRVLYLMKYVGGKGQGDLTCVLGVYGLQDTECGQTC